MNKYPYFQTMLIDGNKDYNIFETLFSNKFLSNIPEQYITVHNPLNNDFINLPRINNNNLPLKTLISNKRSAWNSYTFVSDPLKKNMLDDYSHFSFTNNEDLHLTKKTQSFYFSILLYFFDKNKNLLAQYPQQLFLAFKELNYLINYEPKYFDNSDDLPANLFSYKESKNIELTSNMKELLYKQIEELVSYDHDFCFAHLFNFNTLYDLGLPIFTDHKHGYILKPETLNKIYEYSNIVNIDFSKSNNLGNKYLLSSHEELNGVTFTSPSVYLETLMNMAFNMPTDKFFHNSPFSPKRQICNIVNDERYSLENKISDFLHPQILSLINNDLNLLSKHDKRNLFLQSQIINITYPLCKKVFENHVYNKIPLLEPTYWDNIIRKIFQYKLSSEPRFTEEHIKLSVKEFPSIVYQNIMNSNYHEAIFTQKELCQELNEIFKKENSWKTIFALNNLSYDPGLIGDSKKRSIDKFMTEALPKIREISLLSSLDENQSTQKYKKKI